MKQFSDEEILDLLKTDSELAIEVLFSMHYEYLCINVNLLIHDTQSSEDIVQEVFSEVWKKRQTINIKSSIKGYLRRAAINKTLNMIRSKRFIIDEANEHTQVFSKEHSIQKALEGEELQVKINSAIDKLPKKCKLIFSMSRFEELSYKEIAESLDISVKTVENQISKALRIMKEEFPEYF